MSNGAVAKARANNHQGTTMSKIIRVGMIGAGAISSSHCSGVNSHPQAKVMAVADLSKKRASELAAEFKIERQYNRWEKLVADPELDAITIGLPNALHAPVAIAALKAGKHVMLDKPFALNAQEAAAVIQTAKQARKVFMLGMNQRFTPAVQALHTMIGRGDLGEVFHAKAYWTRRGGSPKFGTWFCHKAESGGGGMLDIGVHALDITLYMMNNFKPVSVSGRVYTKFGNRGIGEGGWGKSDRGKLIFDVDDSAFAFIKFANGATLELNATWVLPMEPRERMNVELFGSEGGATVNPFKAFRYGKHAGEYEIYEPQGIQVDYPNGNRHANWIDVILGLGKPATPPAQSLVVQKIIDAVYQSSATGREVRLKV